MVSLHTGHPALKTSIFRLAFCMSALSFGSGRLQGLTKPSHRRPARLAIVVEIKAASENVPSFLRLRAFEINAVDPNRWRAEKALRLGILVGVDPDQGNIFTSGFEPKRFPKVVEGPLAGGAAVKEVEFSFHREGFYQVKTGE